MLPKKKSGLPSESEAGSSLQSVFAEAAALAHRLRLLRKQLKTHDAGSHNGRGILHDLAHHGPQTVPHIARSRKLSRQHIQTLVNRMEGEGQLEFVDNPAHQRSSLVRISPKGKELLAVINHQEERHWAKLEIELPEKEVRHAFEVLGKLRELIDRAEKSTLPRSTSTRSAFASPRRKLPSQKQKIVRPVARLNAVQTPEMVSAPEALSTHSDLEELPISMF